MPRGERLPWRRDACRPLPGAWLNAGMAHAGMAAGPAPAAPRCGRVAAGKRRTSQQNACRASRRRRAIAAGGRQTGTRPARSPRGSGRARQPPRLRTHAVWNPRAAPVALRRRHSGATGPLGPPWRAEAPTRPPRPEVLRGRIPRAERRRATRRVARGWRAWAPVVEGPPRPGASPPVSSPSLHRAPVMRVQRHDPAVGRHHGRASPPTRPQSDRSDRARSRAPLRWGHHPDSVPAPNRQIHLADHYLNLPPRASWGSSIHAWPPERRQGARHYAHVALPG